MKEIVHLSIGQCGNRIGHDYFKILFNNCSIDPNGIYYGEDEHAKINVYFNEIDKQHYKPRALLIDLQQDTIFDIQNKSCFTSYSNNQILSTTGTQNNWAQGYYSQGSKIIDSILDKLSKETEECSSLQGFQLTNSISGGTGSGLSCLIIQKLKDYYSDTIVSSYPVFSSEQTDNIPNKLYNEILSFNQLIENADFNSIFDNTTLKMMQTQLFKNNNLDFDEINNQVAKTIMGITCPLVFPAETNENLRKMCINFLPFPHLNFLLPSQAPLIPRNYQQFRYITVPELMQQLYSHKNVLCEVDIRYGKYLCGAIHFQGYISEQLKQDIDFSIFSGYRNSSYFVEWISQTLKYAICSKSIPTCVKNSATFIGNNTAITQLLQQKVNSFNKHFKNRNYIQYYLSEGIDELEIMEASINLNNLISDYLYYQNIEDQYEQNEEILEYI